MKITRNKLYGIVAFGAAVLLSLLIWEWYYRTYTWPSQVQNNVLGKELATPEHLLSKDGFSAYGEGLFRWKYAIDPNNTRLEEFCGPIEGQSCVFNRSRTIGEGVEQTVRYEDGILIVEEVWS